MVKVGEPQCSCQNKEDRDMRGEMKRLPKISHPENVIIRRGRCQAYFNYPREDSEQDSLFFIHLPLVKLFPALSFSQEFGLARFKSNQVKAMKGLEYALSNLQGTCTSKIREKYRKQKKKKKGNRPRYF